MTEQIKVVLLRDMHYPAAWVLEYEPLKAGTIVPAILATNIPQDSPTAIRYWVNTPLLRDDPYGIGLCDGDFKVVINRWESKGGKYWVELYHDQHGYSYQGNDCGGNLGDGPYVVDQFMTRLTNGEFQADANKTLMQKVTP